MRKLIVLVGFLMSMIVGAAQEVKVKQSKKAILIGEQLELELSFTSDQKMDVLFPFTQDTLVKGVEILEKVADTVSTDSGITISEKLTLTSFDSGLYTFPKQAVVFVSKNRTDTLYSNELNLLVGTVPVDTTQNFKAIHDIMDAPEYPRDYTWWIIGGLAILIIAGLTFYFIKRFKETDKKVEVEKAEPKEPADIMALRKLNELAEKTLWQEGKLKEYHSQLTDIIREYIGRRYQVSAMESTSDELLELMSNRRLLDHISFEQLKGILVLADLVKFAKKHSLPEENAKSFDDAMAFVNNTKVVETKPSEE